MNRWRIPAALETFVRARDTQCVYCRSVFDGDAPRVGRRPSWEHIVNDVSVITEQNIALCCRSCNSSKGAKRLSRWLESRYCLARGISSKTMATVARVALAREA